MTFLYKYFRRPGTVTVIALSALLASCAHVARTPSDTAAMTEKIAELERKVADLSDREQIRQVYLRYMRGFDRNDVKLMKSAFWPEVQINYGPNTNSLDEFIVKHLNRHTGELASWGHLITNESIDIDGDVAHVEAYVTALWSHKSTAPTFVQGATIVSGRYIDRLDRHDGEWRIAMREFIGHFSAKTEPVFDFSKAADCRMGTWDKRDPSYRRPLTARTSKSDTGAACTE